MLQSLQTNGDFESLEVSISLFCQRVFKCPAYSDLKAAHPLPSVPDPLHIGELLVTRCAMYNTSQLVH